MPTIVRAVSFVLLSRAIFDVAVEALFVEPQKGAMGLTALMNLLVLLCAAYVIIINGPLKKFREQAAWVALLILCAATSLSSREPLASLRLLLSVSTFPCMF